MVKTTKKEKERKKQTNKNSETIIKHKELFTQRERGKRPKIENYCAVKTTNFSKTFE